jgi:hypothetical protein
MKWIKKRLERIEVSRGIRPLHDFERMTPEQMESWCEEATDEDWNQVYKKIMAKVRGCEPWEVEDINTLTAEEVNAKLEEMQPYFTATQA